MQAYEYLLLILGMGLVTYIPRWLPFLILAHRRLPAAFAAWLDLIPVAILSALLLPALLMADKESGLDFFRLEFWIAIPTLLFALKTRSLGGTVLLGMALYWAAGKWLPAGFPY